jgi:hypothetical protein
MDLWDTKIPGITCKDGVLVGYNLVYKELL